MSIKHFAFAVLFFVCTCFGYAQNQLLIDSLQTQLKQLQSEKSELRNNTTSIRDSSIAKILIKLCLAYSDNNLDKAMDYGKQSLVLCEQIAWKKGIASSYSNIGIVYWYQGNYTEALKNQFAALKIDEEIGNKNGIANSYNNIGLVYKNQGNYSEALKNYFAALKIREEIGDKKPIAASYNSIGNVYEAQSNYPEALKNHFSSLKIREEIGDKRGIAISYINIGLVCKNQGNYSEALKNTLAALKIHEETGNKYGIAYSYGVLGEVYNYQGNYPEALKNTFAALKIHEETGSKNGIAASYGNAGEVYIKMNRAKEGKTWLQKALTLSTVIGEKHIITKIYSCLAEADSALGNYKGAFENHKMYIIYRDSLFNEENTKKQTQTEMQYEFDKKETLAKAEQEKKDVIAQKELQKQKLVRNSFVAGFAVVLLFAFVFFRQRTKIEKEKKRSDELLHIVEEKHQEITDSINYAERIQRSFMATQENLNHNLTEYFILFKPKDVVSGDFYWSGNLANNNFALATADSTGHGVPGAIMSLLNITSLEKAVEQNITEPAKILDYTRTQIINRLKKDGSPEGGKDGMDCSLCVYDLKNMKLYVAAANNPVWVVRSRHSELVSESIEMLKQVQHDSEVLEIKPDKMPVGKHDKQDIPFTQHEIELQKGDVVYTLTDGFPDQFGGNKGKKFMIKNLREKLIANAHLPMQEQKQILENMLADWIGTIEQVDDITIIGVRVL